MCLGNLSPPAPSPPLLLPPTANAPTPSSLLSPPQTGSLAGLGPAEVEDVRELLGEERLSRVLLEQAFGWAHMCFAYLAFSSEVRFWRGRTDTGGLSARTLLVNAGCSLIILLYLWEGEGTNRVLLLSSTVEFGVQAWKVLRLLSARGARGRRLLAASAAAEAAAHSGAPQQRADNAAVDAADVREAAREAATESFDALAASVVGAAIAPLGCGLALYTLLTYPHRSWWAWLIDAAAKSVYLFGFVAMTPQLFVNYKLVRALAPILRAPTAARSAGCWCAHAPTKAG